MANIKIKCEVCSHNSIIDEQKYYESKERLFCSICKSKNHSISYLNKNIINKPINKRKRNPKKNHPWAVKIRKLELHQRIRRKNSKKQKENSNSTYSFEEHEKRMKIREKKVKKELNKINASNNKPSQNVKDHLQKGNVRIKEPDGSVRSDWIKDRNSW